MIFGVVRGQVLNYLAAHCTLATTGPDGPWAAGLFYVNDAFVRVAVTTAMIAARPGIPSAAAA